MSVFTCSHQSAVSYSSLHISINTQHCIGCLGVTYSFLSLCSNDAGGLFHRAILMSGSDLSSWAVMKKTQYPREYAVKLSRIVGCGSEPGEGMIRCLRNRKPTDLIHAAEKVPINITVSECFYMYVRFIYMF